MSHPSQPMAGRRPLDRNANHVLYRFFDDDHVLLYVGITIDPGSRWKMHAADKQWWEDVASIEIEPYSNRDAVLAAEKRAIKTERPLYNMIHNDRRADTRQVVRRYCPCCNRAAWYHQGMKRYVHFDGAEHRSCWINLGVEDTEA